MALRSASVRPFQIPTLCSLEAMMPLVMRWQLKKMALVLPTLAVDMRWELRYMANDFQDVQPQDMRWELK
eukprot:5838983-Karenia_brevis.AAC.1